MRSLATTFLWATFVVTSVRARPSLQIRQRAQVVSHCTVPNTAALTFDDGPFDYMYQITNTLKRANASATFFFNGDNYGCIYDPENVKRVKHAYDQGHQVASHTWSHADLSLLSRDKSSKELQRIDQAIERITGAVPGFMRPPYGKRNDRVLQVAAARGQTIVLWDLDVGDSLGLSVAGQKSRYDQLIRRHPSTVLALNHEVHGSTILEVLPYAINRLQSAGYRLVTVAECLGRNPYLKRGTPARRDFSWRC